MTVRILNPLPKALAHYQLALERTLHEGGITTELVAGGNVEADGGSMPRRAAAHVRALVAGRDRKQTTLVLWATFGYFEVVVNRLLGRNSVVVYHDARPLRAEPGMSRWAGRLVGRSRSAAASSRVLVHSRRAQLALEEMGWPRPTLLPHPILPLEVPHRLGGQPPICLVLGMFKESRSVELLAELPSLLVGWRCRIVGRDWPSVDGWEVTSEFVPEAVVREEIQQATVLLIPYEDFFQSGVLVRAFEMRRPAAVIRHEQVEALFGRTWPGIAEEWTPEAVAAAVRRAGEVEPDVVGALLNAADVATIEAWRLHFSERAAAAPS